MTCACIGDKDNPHLRDGENRIGDDMTNDASETKPQSAPTIGATDSERWISLAARAGELRALLQSVPRASVDWPNDAKAVALHDRQTETHLEFHNLATQAGTPDLSDIRQLLAHVQAEAQSHKLPEEARRAILALASVCERLLHRDAFLVLARVIGATNVVSVQMRYIEHGLQAIARWSEQLADQTAQLIAGHELFLLESLGLSAATRQRDARMAAAISALAEASPHTLQEFAKLFSELAENRAAGLSVQATIESRLDEFASQVVNRLENLTPLPPIPEVPYVTSATEAAKLGGLRHAVASLLVEAAQGESGKSEIKHTRTTTTEDLPAGVSVPDFDFLKFEALTRGSEQTISREQEKYLTFFQGSPNVLDAGCGRGEFLELLRHAGVDAYGIDSDPQMVMHCQGKGLRVEQAQILEHLASIPERSLGGIFLGQVVEHLTPDALATLCDLAYRRLRPGGYFVAETINPTCLTVFSGAFYADPTHVKPVHPKALEYFLATSGFADIEFVYSAAVPADEKLAPVSGEFTNPEVAQLASVVAANFDRLNSVMYNHANYAAAGRRPTDR